MQPSYDSWDFEPGQSQGDQWHNEGQSMGGSAPSFSSATGPNEGFEDPNVAVAFGLVDISKGKGKSGGSKGDQGKGRNETWETWDSWETSNEGDFPPQPPPPAMQPPYDVSGKGGSLIPFSRGDQFAGKGGQSPDSFASNDIGKGSGLYAKGPADFGKGTSGKQSFDNGKAAFNGGTGPGALGKGPSNAGAGKGTFNIKGSYGGPTNVGGDLGKSGKPGFSFKGKLAPRKADFNNKGDLPTSKPGNYPQTPPPPAFSESKASVQPAPPPLYMSSKGSGFTQPGKGTELVRAQIPMLVPGPAPLDGRGPVRPALTVAPRFTNFKGDAVKGAPLHKGGPLSGIDARAAAAGLGSALAAVAARGGAGPAFRPPPSLTRYVPPGPPRPLPHGLTPPPPTGPVPAHLLGQGLAASLAKLPPTSGMLALGNTSSAGLAPELAALVSAGEGDHNSLGATLSAPVNDKKPRIHLLVTRLAPELEEGHLQQILEQCGEVQAFRRGRDANGAPLSFGFAQFGDPEAAWKASTCMSKRVLCGQEIKVMVEESAETLIQQWRRSQQAALKVSTDEELDWELERKAVSCKASIDAKVEELFGPPADGAGAGAIVQRQQELREKERARVERMRKRKAWREEEFQRQLALVESAEKRARTEERERDDADREKEQAERKAKEEQDKEDLKLSKMDDAGQGVRLKTGAHADNRRLIDMVDTVQAEARDELFRMELNLPFLRSEKVLEKKLRPWLERKVDLCMGGPQSDLVEYILRRINACSMPDSLISELTRYLDDNAEPLVERMWRMLAFELMRSGVAMTSSLKKEKKEEVPSSALLS